MVTYHGTLLVRYISKGREAFAVPPLLSREFGTSLGFDGPSRQELSWQTARFFLPAAFPNNRNIKAHASLMLLLNLKEWNYHKEKS